MSKFARIALEDENGLEGEVSAAPEAEGINAAVAETEAEAEAVAQEDEGSEQLETEQEQLGELEEAVEAEQDGLSQEAAAILHVSLKRIIGKRLAQKVVALESYGSGRSAQREAKRVALEGIKETLKQFWEAIKAQLKKFYAKVKSFFVKAFSSARKLAERAKKVQERANNTTGSADEKSFSFGQTKAIAVEGKYSDPSKTLEGLKNIRTLIEGIISVQKADKYESTVEDAQKLIEAEIKSVLAAAKANKTLFEHSVLGQGKTKAILDKLEEVGGAGVRVSLTKPDKKLAEQHGGDNDDVGMTPSLPGSKAIFFVVPKIKTATGFDSLQALAKVVKNTRANLGNDKATPREVTEGDVKTLTTSQVDDICDHIIEIAETSYTYEKAWQKRDKFQAKLEREIDSIVKDSQSDDDEKDSRVQRVVRSYAESFTASVRRRTTFESQLISYALSTSAAFLNYAERSLAQYK